MLAFPRVSNKLNKAGEEGSDLHEAVLTNIEIWWRVTVCVSVEQWDTIFIAAWGKLTLALKDVAWLTLLNMFNRGRESCEVKVRYSYNDRFKVIREIDLWRWLRFFNDGDGSQSEFVVGAFSCSCYHGMYCLVDLMQSKPERKARCTDTFVKHSPCLAPRLSPFVSLPRLPSFE